MKYFLHFIVYVLAIFCLPGCDASPKSAKTPNNPYISAYTSGVISVNASIRIRLAQAHDAFEQNAVIEKKLFDCSPSISGEVYWITSTMVEFRPKERLKSDQTYKVSFLVSNLIDGAKGGNKTFKFSVTTIKPSFTTALDPLILRYDDNPDACMLRGEVLTADYVDNQLLEKVLTAIIAGQKTKVEWEHLQAEKKHVFRINDIAIGDKPANMLLQWDGSPIDYDYKHTDTVKLPVNHVFKILDIRTNTQGQYILCTFSELLARQKFDAYVQLDSDIKPRFNAVSNNLYIYLPEVSNRSFKVTVREGLKSKSNTILTHDSTFVVAFDDAKPAIRQASKGVLMPNSTNLTLPFQAINLKAVDVHIYHIFENNILQFLQINNLNSNNELRRVGKPVASTTIKLGESKKINLHQWNTFSLDLAKIMTIEPGAIYEVRISFKRPYSLYGCDDNKATPERESMTENSSAYEEEAEDDDDDYYYDWYERDNPCNDSYYNSNRFITQNVIASNLGIIAKQESDDGLMVAVNDLTTTESLNGVVVSAYNYQQQKITEGRTDNDGLIHLIYKERPYVIVATQDKQKSYLRVDDGVSLSLSAFDVAGAEIKKGINGFLYGERGVWRPGDTIFLSFILQDVNETLPANHPVVFELYNVKNQLVNRIVHTTGKQKIYAFPSATSPDAPTGRWEAKVTVGGVTFYESVNVATIKPNRLKIATTLDNEIVAGTQNIGGELAVKWLHGANAPGLKADITARFSPQRTVFKNFPDYNFEDIIKQENRPSEKTFTGRLNDNGVMRFNIATGSNDEMPGSLQAALNIRVFEEGGEFSVDHAAVRVMPYSSYVGLKAPAGEGYYNRLGADTEHLFNVVTVDDGGKPVKRNVEVNIYRTEWSWWWSSSNNSIANYTHRIYQNKVHSTELTTSADGKGSFKFGINRPEWGMFLVQVIDRESGHSMSQRIYIDWWSYGRGDDRPESASMLTFNADKEKYNVGEDALITIPSTAGARALVSLETGSSVLHTFWIECKDTKTDITIPTTSDMTPNVYVHITLLQPHAQTKNDLPIRLYGVIPLMVENPKTRLYPVVNSPDVVHPDEPFTVQVSEQNGKEMSYTLAIVDDGLLDLTHFKTPSPWDHFFKRQALGIRTWDVYNFVMGAYGGKIEQIFAIGGDESLTPNNGDAKANRFKPVVKFAGPFVLKAGKKAEHTFTINNYVGSVRTMVVAATDHAYGATGKTSLVRSPLMVQATLPRVLGPGETVALPVTIFAMGDQVKNVDVALLPNDLFEVIGKSSRSITFHEQGDDMVYFNIRTKKKVGRGSVKITAVSGSEKAENTIEIDVRASNPAIVTSEEKIIPGNQSVTLTLRLPGMEGTNTAELEASGIPPLNLGERLNYLLSYPHGCLEQTTSSAFPQLYLADVVDLSEAKKKQAENNIKAALQRLKLFVTVYGSFSYWPGGTGYTCAWTNNYAGHFMMEAERKGYHVPETMKGKWIAAQQKAAKEWIPENNIRYQISQSDFIQAYRLYVLALAKKPELSAMNRLKESYDLSPQAKWMLAGAYLLAGQPETAKNIIRDLPLSVAAYEGSSETYGSSARDEAMILEILTLLNDRENAFAVAKRISEALNSRAWMSTQTTACCLLGLSKYAAITNGELNFSYTGANKTAEQVTSKKTVWSAGLGAQTGTQTTVKIDNRSAAAMFVRLSAKGLPAAGREERSQNNLRLQVHYFDTNNNPLDVQTLRQGTDFEAEVRITNPGLRGQYADMALTQIFPSGWEITENRLNPEKKNSGVTYMDIRDDRVLAYFDLPATLTLRVKLHAAYKGTFYLPATACEAMYDHSISANTTGQWVTVE
ncbi:MAG: hypothetical protein LBU42_07540 [Prevotellaceae bacterium]|jgi:uncharacterized protein YfaS (alpha-2-macroglobulin family)|nr:hypothetical protein [Prevotellaceae bacterium]